jgi:nucleotide-binding universal stress UspA family protein
MYRRILVALNGTQQAEQVLPHATEIARCTGATIVIVRALRERAEVLQQSFESGGLGAPPPTDIADRAALDEAAATDAYFARVQAGLARAGVPCELVVQEGDPVTTLKTVVAQQQIDLIALTTSGRSALAKLFAGSTADSLLHDVHVPLLLLRVEK